MSLPLPEPVKASPNERALSQGAVPLTTDLFLRLATAGNKKLSFGTDTLTWPGATTTTTKTVTHGLGTTPTVALVIPANSATGILMNMSVGSLGATTFVAQAATIDASTPALSTTVTLYWIAIG